MEKTMEKKKGRPSWKEKAGIKPMSAEPTKSLDEMTLVEKLEPRNVALLSKKAPSKSAIKLSGYVAKTAFKCTSGIYKAGDELPMSDVEENIDQLLAQGVIAPMYAAESI